MPVRGYSKGAQKALRAMKQHYGNKRGTRIFYATANKFRVRGQSVSNYYRTHGHQRGKK